MVIISSGSKDDLQNAKSALQRSKEYLQRYGWQKGSMGVHQGPRCLLGALSSVAHLTDSMLFDNAYFFLTSSLGCGVADFNDAAKDVDEVYALIDKVIAKIDQDLTA